jgi:hypothetical protein
MRLLLLVSAMLVLAGLPPGLAQAPGNCPLNFTATGQANGSVMFHWSGFGGADGYQVFGYQGRGNTAGYSPLLNSGSRDYTASNLAPGNYTFWVNAYHSGSIVAQSCQRTTTVPPGFAATFTNAKGNEWWEEVTVHGSAPITRVDVNLNHAETHPLTLRSWGAWAGSFHAPPATLVQFIAYDTSGHASASGCYHWTDAAPEPCSRSPPPPQPVPTAVSYYGVKGNEWWIEAHAASKSPISAVDARVNGGPWTAMSLRSWGAWAASMHAPNGSHVQFRAHAPDGTPMFVPDGWVWTTATPWPPAASTFDARFENVKGNPNWVQVNVYAATNWGLQGVSFRIDGGPWHPLAQQGYGDWTAAFPVPDGSFVQFRAESSQTLLSGSYRWPAATPVPAWPVAGSYATYHVNGGSGDPGGSFDENYNGTITFRFTAGTWQATCDFARQRYDAYPPTYTNWTTHTTATLSPPTWPTNVTAGQEIDLDGLADCQRTQLFTQVVGPTTFVTQQSGIAVDALAWHAYLDNCGCHEYSADWARHQGLLFGSSFAGMAEGVTTKLLDTDAPIG